MVTIRWQRSSSSLVRPRSSGPNTSATSVASLTARTSPAASRGRCAFRLALRCRAVKPTTWWQSASAWSSASNTTTRFSTSPVLCAMPSTRKASYSGRAIPRPQHPQAGPPAWTRRLDSPGARAAEGSHQTRGERCGPDGIEHDVVARGRLEETACTPPVPQLPRLHYRGHQVPQSDQRRYDLALAGGHGVPDAPRRRLGGVRATEVDEHEMRAALGEAVRVERHGARPDRGRANLQRLHAAQRREVGILTAARSPQLF